MIIFPLPHRLFRLPLCRQRSGLFFRNFVSSRINYRPQIQQEDLIFNQIKKLYKNPHLDQATKLNQILSVLNEAQFESIFDPRYQSIISNIRLDNDISNDAILDLNQVFEVYHQNKQHQDNFKFELLDYSKLNSGKVKKTTILGKELTKKQIIGVYFGSMSALLVAVTMYGVLNINIFQFTGLFGLVLWISFTFNPF